MIQDLNYQKISKPHEKNNDDYAAVSILIHDEKEIIFIKRSEDLPTHKGHIAFPGGKKEKTDNSLIGQTTIWELHLTDRFYFVAIII